MGGKLLRPRHSRSGDGVCQLTATGDGIRELEGAHDKKISPNEKEAGGGGFFGGAVSRVREHRIDAAAELGGAGSAENNYCYGQRNRSEAS